MSRVVPAAAIVPAAPLMVPSASPDQPDEIREEVASLREAAHRVLANLPTTDVVVLLAAGARGFHDTAHATLRPFGVRDAEVTLPVARDLISHVTRLTQYPVFVSEDLDASHAVLALLLHAARGPVPVLPLAVPPGTDGDVLVHVGASLLEGLRDAGMTATMVSAGDLSACLDESSPGYVVAGAQDWDRAAVTAIRRGDAAGFADLGPQDADRLMARSWPPLAVLAGAVAAARLSPTEVRYAAPRGVGEVVAAYADLGGEEAGARYERSDDHPA